MQQQEQIDLVQQMIDYILAHYNDTGFDSVSVPTRFGYSRRHTDRVFSYMTGKTPAEYLRAVRLTKSAAEILKKESSILSIALDAQYNSHEGYIRAFEKQFGTTPTLYQSGKVPIPLFVPYPVRQPESCHDQKGEKLMEQKVTVCTATIIKKPKRKIMMLYSKKAVDYWTFCEEKSCEWEGLLNSIAAKLDTASIAKLPPFLQKQGFSDISAAVELSDTYTGSVPDGYGIAELPPCEMLVFQTEPYENEDDFCEAIQAATRAIEHYDPRKFGYEYAPDLAPPFNYGAQAATGAKLAVAVRKTGEVL